jgi:hypothetical protein
MIALIGIILLIGIVKKNAIMMIDFALEASATRAAAERGDLQACLLRFRPIMMTTLAALLGARCRWRSAQRHGRGAAAAARHHHRRRPAGEPGADAVHDAGDLPGLRLAARFRATAGQEPVPSGSGRSAMNCPAPFIGGRSPPRCSPSVRRCSGMRGVSFLPVASLPQGRFADHQRLGLVARGEPRDDGLAVAAPLERSSGASPASPR